MTARPSVAEAAVSTPAPEWEHPIVRFGPAVVAALLTSFVLATLDELPLYVDGPSYLAIAQHWADGNWSAAVNGYWSPLLSFTLVPAALAGVPLRLAAAVLSVLTAAAAIAALQYLLKRSGADAAIAAVLSAGAAPFVAFAAIDNLTPDLLMAVFLVVFVTDLVATELSHPIRTGLVGGLAFLAKTYALPFMIVFLAALVVERVAVRSLRSSRTSTPSNGDHDGTGANTGVRQLRPVIIAGVTMLAVAATWSLVISVDEGRLTYSTAAGYNTAITAPGSSGVSFAGLTEPDHPAAHWAWEDPAALRQATVANNPATANGAAVDSGHQRSFGSRVVDRAERILDNVERAVRASALIGVSAVLAGAALVWFLGAEVGERSRPTAADRRRRRRRIALWLGVATAIYGGGLLWLIVQPRYLYFALLIMIGVVALGLSELLARHPTRRHLVVAITIAIALGTAARPSVALFRLYDRVDAIHELEEFLDTVDVTGDRVASSPAQLHVIGARCLEQDCVYLGAPRVGAGEDVPAQLEQFDVDVFIVRDDRRVEIPAGAELAARSDELGYSIFALPTPAD